MSHWAVSGEGSTKRHSLLSDINNDGCPIPGLNVSVVSSRQVLGIQCHCTEPRRMGGGRTSSSTNFSSKVSRKRFQRSKSLVLYLCTLVQEFMLHESNSQTMLLSKPRVFLPSDVRKKTTFCFITSTKTNLVRRHQGVYFDLPVAISKF